MALALMLKKHPLAKRVEVGTGGHLWASCWLHQDPLPEREAQTTELQT